MFVIEFYIRSQGFEGHEQYLQATRMNKPGVWATDIEIYTLLHLLNTPIVVSAPHANGWVVGRDTLRVLCRLVCMMKMSPPNQCS